MGAVLEEAMVRYALIPDWRDEIQVGDVLYSKSGTPRVVRSVSKRRGFLGCVKFTIRKCSWTGRCYTVVSRSDLKWRGFTPSGVRKTEMTLMDKRINRAIIDYNYRKLDCCDVRAIL